MTSLAPFSTVPFSGGSSSLAFPTALNGQFVLITISRDDGTIERYSREGFPSVVGMYEARIASFGNVVYEQGDPEGNMQTPTVSFRLFDPDNAILENIVAGVNYVGARIDITLSDLTTYLFSGRIADFQPGDEFSWQVQCRPRDLALAAKIPSTVFALQDWPKMDQALLGKVVPWTWGIYDSAGVGGDSGAVPTFLVDTVGFRYLVSFGWVAVMRIYKDKTNVVVGPGWSVQHVVVNGRRYTLLKFTATQGQSVITADIFGYPDNSAIVPPTGLIDTQQPQDTFHLIQEPGSMTVHILSNLLLTENTTGVFSNVAHPDIDEAAFLAMNDAISPIIPYRASPYFNQQMTGYSALNELSKCFGWVLFWNERGQISVASPWQTPGAGTISDPWVREDGDILEVRRSFIAKDKVAKIVAAYGQNPANTSESTGQDRQGVAHALSGNALPTGTGELNISSQFAPAFL